MQVGVIARQVAYAKAEGKKDQALNDTLPVYPDRLASLNVVISNTDMQWTKLKVAPFSLIQARKDDLASAMPGLPL